MTEKSIRDKLLSYFYKDASTRLMIENVFIFDWESDFFILQRNNFCVEFEIKISKSDFKADFNKEDKHIFLKTGIVTKKKYVSNQLQLIQTKSNHRPNKFYYVTPHGLLNIDDIPEYSGLIEIDKWDRINLIKKAPFIHKERLELSNTICDKLYYKWLKLRMYK